MADHGELKSRIEAKKHKIQKEIAELKADASKENRERIDGLQQRLDDLQSHLSDDWKNLTDSVTGKLNEWLKNDT